MAALRAWTGVAAVFAAAIWTGSATAQIWDNTYPVIVATVTDEVTAAPVVGARVSVGVYVPVWMNTDPPTWSMVFEERYHGITNSDGRCSIGVTPATYAIVVSADGYATELESNVAVTSSLEVFLQLRPLVTPSLMTVDCVKYSTVGGKNSTRDLLVRVVIRDDFGKPVTGASVDIELTRNGSLAASATVTTSSKGVASLKLRRAPNGAYSTLVTGVRKSGFYYAGSATTPVNEFRKGTDPSPTQFCQ